MQSNINDVYRMTSERTGDDEQLIKDIGVTVFSSLQATLKNPPTLIIKIKGLGSWHLRKKRMEIMLTEHPVESDQERESKIILHNLFKERMLDYERYLKERDEIRSIRRKTQFIINDHGTR